MATVEVEKSLSVVEKLLSKESRLERVAMVFLIFHLVSEVCESVLVLHSHELTSHYFGLLSALCAMSFAMFMYIHGTKHKHQKAIDIEIIIEVCLYGTAGIILCVSNSMLIHKTLKKTEPTTEDK